MVEGVNGGGVFVVFWVGDFAAPEDVVGQDVAADGGFGEDEVEIFLVVLLVGVDEHEVEWARECCVACRLLKRLLSPWA